MSELTIKVTGKTGGKTPIRTQKKRIKGLSKSKKKKLWELYDNEMSAPDESMKETSKDGKDELSDDKSENIDESKKLECVYRSCGEREVCDICNEAVFIGENGFLTCSNKSCGIIYSDSLDLGAEWRF